MTPLFPRSGPGESGSPMSQVVLRCYDFPARIPGHLFVSLPGSTLPSSVRVSRLALALPEGRRVPSGPGSLFSRRPNGRLALTWTWAGSPRFPGDPSCAFASVHDPGRIDDPSPVVGFVDAAPAQTTAKASASWLYRGYRGASAPVAYASRMVLPPSMQGSLPAGWLAFTGRELNPLDRDEGFQITSSSSLPGLFLAQRPKTCTEAASRAAKKYRRNLAPRPDAIGHESMDTDITYKMDSETYVLQHGHFQI